MDTRNILINDFLAFDGMRNITRIDDFSTRIKKYMSISGETDTELEHILIALKVNHEDCESSNFVKCSEIALPIFEWLKTKKDLEFIETVILGTVLSHAPDYKLAAELSERAISVLKSKYANVKNCKSKIGMIYSNMTCRLIRARYIDIKNTTQQKEELKQVEKLFAYHLEQARIAWSVKSENPFNAVLDIRKALFEGDCKGIADGLDRLKKPKGNDWLKVTKDEVNEYLSNLNDRLTPALRRLLIGRRIQARREALNMTVKEFAELLDTDPVVVNEFERGDSGIGQERLRKIAKILNIDIAYFTGDSDSKPDDFEYDILLTTLAQILRNAKKKDKQYLIDFAKSYIKHQENLDTDDN